MLICNKFILQGRFYLGKGYPEESLFNFKTARKNFFSNEQLLINSYMLLCKKNN